MTQDDSLIELQNMIRVLTKQIHRYERQIDSASIPIVGSVHYLSFSDDLIEIFKQRRENLIHIRASLQAFVLSIL